MSAVLHQEYENEVHDKVQVEQEELAHTPSSTVSPSSSPVQPPAPLFEQDISTSEDDQTSESFSDTGKLQKP